jgi:hypothetical protein
MKGPIHHSSFDVFKIRAVPPLTTTELYNFPYSLFFYYQTMPVINLRGSRHPPQSECDAS